MIRPTRRCTVELRPPAFSMGRQVRSDEQHGGGADPEHRLEVK
jgi:hypothetical protein